MTPYDLTNPEERKRFMAENPGFVAVDLSMLRQMEIGIQNGNAQLNQAKNVMTACAASLNEYYERAPNLIHAVQECFFDSRRNFQSAKFAEEELRQLILKLEHVDFESKLPSRELIIGVHQRVVKAFNFLCQQRQMKFNPKPPEKNES